jgi:hypothetical protein
MKINDINNPINENTDMTTGDVKYLVSDGAQRYFIFTYPVSGRGNPMHLRNQLDAKAKELSFKRHNVVAQWAGDINMAIAKAKNTMAEFEDRKKDFPSQYYGSVKTAEELEAAKDIMSNKDILEDTPLLDDVEDMTEIDDMEHTDEPAISGEDVLRMVAQRGIISRKQYHDPEPILLDMAEGMAEMLTPGDIAGSSDVSSLMKDFVATAEAELVLLLGPKVDAYYAIKKDRPVDEARNPMAAINKFLKQKDDNAARGDRLRKERDAREAPKAAPRELGESKRRRK